MIFGKNKAIIEYRNTFSRALIKRLFLAGASFKGKQ
jgi:hypothetical protein